MNKSSSDVTRAVRERASSVLLASVKRGRNIGPVLADLYALLHRENRVRKIG